MVQGNFISPASRGHEVLPEEDEASHLGDLTGLTPRALQKGIARVTGLVLAVRCILFLHFLRFKYSKAGSE